MNCIVVGQFDGRLLFVFRSVYVNPILRHIPNIFTSHSSFNVIYCSSSASHSYVIGHSHRSSCIFDTYLAALLDYTQSQEILVQFRCGFECLSRVSIILFVAAPWSPPVFSIQYKRSDFSQKQPKSGKQLHSMRNLRLTLLPSCALYLLTYSMEQSPS